MIVEGEGFDAIEQVAVSAHLKLERLSGPEGDPSQLRNLFQSFFLTPTGLLGLASALLVLGRKPLGVRLALPFCVLLAITAIMTFFEVPPVGGFLDDYEQASLARGVDVPTYLEEKGTTPEEYIQSETGDVRAQGALGSIAVLVIYVATVLRGSRTRPKQASAKA